MKNSTLEASVACLNTQLESVSDKLADAELKNQTLFTENKALHTQVDLMQKDLEETEARSMKTERLKLESTQTQQANLAMETLIATLCQQLADSEALCNQITSNLAKCQAENDELKQDMSCLEQLDLELDSLISTHDLSLTQCSSNSTLSSSSSPAAVVSEDTETSPTNSIRSLVSQNSAPQASKIVNANLGSVLENKAAAVEPLERPANQDDTCSGPPTVTSEDGIEDYECSFIPAYGGVHTVDAIRLPTCVDGYVASTVSNKQLLMSPSCRSTTISPDSLWYLSLIHI